MDGSGSKAVLLPNNINPEIKNNLCPSPSYGEMDTDISLFYSFPVIVFGCIVHKNTAIQRNFLHFLCG